MADIASMLNAFSEVAAHPSKELDKHLAAGKRVIGVGGGEKKVRSILGALNGHYLHALITDVQTAEKVLELADA